MLAAILAVTSCQEKDIEVFGEEHILYFDKFWTDADYPGTEKADSTNVTFFFVDEDQNQTYADLIVVLAGRKPAQNLDFKLRVVPELTTAQPDEYTLSDRYTFRNRPIAPEAKQIQDTIRIQINRSKRLETLEQGFRLVLEMVPDGNVSLGQKERIRSIIHVTKNPVKPNWWNKEIEVTLLGTYTAKKYKLFLDYVEGAELLNEMMIKERPDEARRLVLTFKQWLVNNPTTEEDGSPMELPI